LNIVSVSSILWLCVHDTMGGYFTFSLFWKDYFYLNVGQKKRKSYIPPKVHLSLASYERFLLLQRMRLFLIWDTYWVLLLYDCMIDDGYLYLHFFGWDIFGGNIWIWIGI